MLLTYISVVAAHVISIYLIANLATAVLPCCFISCLCKLAIGVVCVFVARYTFAYCKQLYLADEVDLRNKAVLITGCDSGFGNLLARRLDEKGFVVFASCLFPSGTEAQKLVEASSSRLKVFGLDVTKDEDVKEALRFVKENLGPAELWGIVNNAGIAKGTRTECSTLDDFKQVFEVNTFGPVRIINTFLPLIRRAKGRIVNVTSAGGRINVPFLTPYTSSKFAFVGLNDALRKEVSCFGVKVISIEPEMFLTGLTCTENVSKIIEASQSKVDKEVREAYESNSTDLTALTEWFTKNCSSNIDFVVNDIVAGISLKCPDSVYKPRRNLVLRILLDIHEVLPCDVQDLIIRAILILIGYGVISL